MKKEKTEKKHKNTDKGQVFVKVVAGILAMLMILTTAATLIFTLIG